MIHGYIVTGVQEELLFEEGREDAGIISCKIKTALNEVDSAVLTFPASNKYASSLPERGGVVKIFNNGTAVFMGSVTSGKVSNVTEATTVELDGALGWLQNVCKSPFSVGSSSANKAVQNYLSAIVQQYNDACDDYSKLVELGNVTVTGNVSVDHSEEYTRTLDLFREVVEQLGGYFYVIYNVSSPPSIVYVDYPSTATGQVLEVGVNVSTAERQLDFTDYASRVYATGKADGGALIDIGYVMDAEAETAWGRVDFPYSSNVDNSGKTAAQARAAIVADATAELNVRKNPFQTIQMTALDLADVGVDYKLFHIGTVVRAVCRPINIDLEMIVQSIERDYINKTNTVVTFGKAPRTLTGMMQ